MPKALIHTADSVLEQTFEAGDLLAEIALAAGVLFDRPCAGRGACGKCRMEVKGKLSKPSPAELKKLTDKDFNRGIRLSCQTVALGEIEVTVARNAVITDKIFQTGLDWNRVRGDLGLAIDLGSTTVGAFLVDLKSARPLAGHAVLNRQTVHGAEIISRLALAEREPETLRNLAWQSIFEAVSGLRIPPLVHKRIRRAVVVGNTAMHHLLLGLSVATLVRSPFEPADKKSNIMECGSLLPLSCAPAGRGAIHGRSNGHIGLVKASDRREIRVRKEKRRQAAALQTGSFPILFPPLIGGFVGSDALACLLYFGFDQAQEPKAALDLGTNGEVMLTDGKRILAASTAAGPAFEGVNIACGMRALPGAIVRAYGDNGKFSVETIGSTRPKGIAGSGLISLTRVLRDLGWIDKTGRLVQASKGSSKLHLKGEGKAMKLWLSEEVYLTQADLRELQKAKAAVRAALEILLQRLSLKPRDLRKVFLTGSFGGRVPVEDALALGLLPKVAPVRVRSIPNGAGLGAALMLRQKNFKRAEELARRVEHVELNRDPKFQGRFIEAMALP